jgi:O-antigen/teichoic acid export membrane protein
MWAFAGNVTFAASRGLILVVLTKLAPVELVGIYGVAQAISVPISRLLSLQLGLVQITDARNDYRFGHYYTVKLITGVLAVIGSAIVGFLFYSGQTALVVTFLSIGYAIVEMRKVFLAVMQKFEHMNKVALSNFLEGVLSTIIFAVTLWLTQSLVLGICGLICARLIVVCSYDRRRAQEFLNSSIAHGKADSVRIVLSKRPLWNITKTAIPLGLVGWLGSLFTSVPRLVLDKDSGKETVGYFAAMSSLLIAATMVMSALNQAVTPRLAKYYCNNVTAYTRLLAKLVAIGAILGILGIVVTSLLGEYVLAILFRPDYAEYKQVFTWIAVAGAVLFVFTFMNCGLNAARKFKIQVPIYGSAALICCVSSVVLIPPYGMAGASWSIIACYIFGTVSSGVFVIKAITEKTKNRKLADFQANSEQR